MSPEAAAGTTLRLVRTFEAPREEVFSAWTEAERLTDWFGSPAGTAERAEVDLRVGGDYVIELMLDEGALKVIGRYLEIEPPERLRFTFRWDPIPHDLFDIGDSVVGVEFHQRGDATEVVLTHEGLPAEAHRLFHELGWGVCLDRLSGLEHSP